MQPSPMSCSGPRGLYTHCVQKILARYRVKKIVKSMAHITGGGLPGNLPPRPSPGLCRATQTRRLDTAAHFHLAANPRPGRSR